MPYNPENSAVRTFFTRQFLSSIVTVASGTPPILRQILNKKRRYKGHAPREQRPVLAPPLSDPRNSQNVSEERI
jgi:hypothetical protein